MTSLDVSPTHPLHVTDESAENHFRRYFPHNTRLSCFTADEQFELLYRAYWLCVKSNRRKELKINHRIPDPVFVARRSDGVCCHPIFISQPTFKQKRSNLQDPAFVYQLMVSNCMLHPTYCEEVRHGDWLKLVVPDEFQAATNRHRLVNEFNAGEGCFIWHVDRQHPAGYPQLLIPDTDQTKSFFDFEI